MNRARVIPVLTIEDNKLVKTIKFKRPNYIGDPINAVKIFNDKEVDEIVLLDISATKEGREPSYSKIEEICSEAFMPFAYGGGIKNIDQIKNLFQLGIEKIVLNSILNKDIELVRKAASIFGSQSIIASIDIKQDIFGKYHAYTNAGKKRVSKPLLDYIKEIEKAGVGEVFLNSIDRDGTYNGYDFSIIEKISNNLELPLVACGGASELNDFKKGIEAGASAVAAGSLFVYRSKSKGVLINYPSQITIQNEILK